MTESLLLKERERANLAKQVLDNPLWQEAVEKVAKSYRSTMESETATDEAALEARRSLHLLKQVQRQIETVMQTGKMADMELERIHRGRN